MESNVKTGIEIFSSYDSDCEELRAIARYALGTVEIEYAGAKIQLGEQSSDDPKSFVAYDSPRYRHQYYRK